MHIDSSLIAASRGHVAAGRRLKTWLERADVGAPTWWRDVQAHGTPLQAPGPDRGSDTPLCELLFLWRDPHGGPAVSPVQAVYIEVEGHTPHPTEALTPLLRLGQTDVWYWATELPQDWLGSYVLVPTEGAASWPPRVPSERRRWWHGLMQTQACADVLNPWPAQRLGWARARSALRLGGQRMAVAWPDAPQGRLQQWHWHSARLGRERPVWLYAPPVPVAAPRPWVLLLDGQVWAGPQGLWSALDALTQQGRIAPACYLAVASGDAATRWRELACHRPFWEALHDELWPMAQAHAHVAGMPGPAGRACVVGQSLGGLAAVYAALHWPERYGMALSQSGSFWWPSVEPGPDHAELLRQVQAGLGAGSHVRFVLQAGVYEHDDMQQLSQALAEHLDTAGHSVRHQPFRGGHDWLCWREALLQGLSDVGLAEPAEPAAARHLF